MISEAAIPAFRTWVNRTNVQAAIGEQGPDALNHQGLVG